jgi:hypothetical protein
MKKLKVKFSVSGWVTTEVEVPDAVSPQELQEGLNSGKYLTSMFPGASVVELKGNPVNDLVNIGDVLECIEPDCEYSDFEVDEFPLDNQG